MTPDGRVVYSYDDNDMKSPTGLYCDSGDIILVCGDWSHNVQVITADGRVTLIREINLISRNQLSFAKSTYKNIILNN